MKCLKAKEHDVQRVIVRALRLAGFHVYETTAYRQKGPSGMDKGIPDLLVSHPLIKGYFVGLEVKRDEKAPLTQEQVEAVAAERYVTTTGPDHAVRHCLQRLLCASVHWSDPAFGAEAVQEARLNAVERATRVADQLGRRKAA